MKSRFCSVWGARVLLVVLALVLTRCGKDLATGPASGTFTNVYVNTLKSACIECHVPTGSAAVDNGVQLDFSTQAKAYETLTTKNVTTNSTSICNGVKIVVASNAARSYLAAVLFSDYSKNDFVVSGCTPYNLHHTDQNLSASEKTSMLAWINGGAKND